MGVCSPCQPLFVLLEREQSEGSSSHPSALHGAALGCCKARDEAALSAGVVQCCHGTFMELPGSSGQGMFPQPQTGSPSPGSCSCPSHVSGRFLIPNPPGHPGEEPRVLAMPAAHHSAAISDVCPQRPTGAPAAPSPCGYRVGMPFSEICFNHIYTV